MCGALISWDLSQTPWAICAFLLQWTTCPNGWRSLPARPMTTELWFSLKTLYLLVFVLLEQLLVWWEAFLQPDFRAADEEVLHHAQVCHSISPSDEWSSGDFESRDQEDFEEDGKPVKERLVSSFERCIVGIPDSLQDPYWHVTLPYCIRKIMSSANGVVA
jgi:hypothetical protein